MSPPITPAVQPRRIADTLARLRVQLGREAHDERHRRRWTLAELAARAGVSVATAQRIEAGQPASLECCVRVGLALGLEPQLGLAAPRRAGAPSRDGDPVHAALGEIEAAHFRRPGAVVLLDEPYQHYQFAGRADLLVADPAALSLLHIENRTRFPDIQAFAGVWNAKRSYLVPEIARRVGLRAAPIAVDHVIVALWSSEVIHALRLRRHSFAALAPDQPVGFAAWWEGAPVPAGTRASLVFFDPLTGERRSRRRWVGLDRLDGLAPRYRGYADALGALHDAGLA
jgi:transcriptional regulator with XRE-family HTH domain